MVVLGAVETDPVAEVIVSVELGVAAEVVVAVVTPEAVAPDVPVTPEAVVEVVADEDEEMLFEVFVGAVCAGMADG